MENNFIMYKNLIINSQSEVQKNSIKTHPVVLLYKSLTSIITPYMAKYEKVQGKCSCCERPAEEFNYLNNFAKCSGQVILATVLQ
ncbi:hypothetical protein DUQ60_23410 [Salmonella enterica subsp. enterica]|uniref:Uncharacterized protein n=1 Tax=Salmonella enterica subsp. enterica serovar Lattenkamp TaxID=2564671 RepID=A0A5W2LYT8_SALET|nr:hypothetical protein [Salmonella enterica subsp. enterica serovar Lattenkamp]EAR5596506.1 hypothetical protein [Salmonella enterica]EBK5132521.1 hypothetical protein [Salmonella enterica]EBW4471197.1 hypothetical protein [Salmonella enterica subsp. enterica serovar Lattenkamp]